YREGRNFGGGVNRPYVPVPGAPAGPGRPRGPINNWAEAVGPGAVLALDATRGEPEWRFPMTRVTGSSMLTTAERTVFARRRATRAPARSCGRRTSARRSRTGR